MNKKFHPSEEQIANLIPNKEQVAQMDPKRAFVSQELINSEDNSFPCYATPMTTNIPEFVLNSSETIPSLGNVYPTNPLSSFSFTPEMGNSRPLPHISTMMSHTYLMEEYNKSVDVAKKYKKNMQEEELLNKVHQISMSLIHLYPIEKINSFIESGAPITKTILTDFSWKLGEISSLNPIGIYLQTLTCISMATRGRVQIDCGDWYEATPIMTIQVSDSGTKKSAIVSSLRQPFDEYTDKNNRLINNNLENAKDIKLVKDIADKDHKKRLRKEIPASGITKEVLEVMLEKAKEYKEQISSLPINESKEYQLLMDSGSVVGLRNIMVSQGEACGIITAESNFIVNMLMKSSGDPAFFNHLYTQEPYNISTKQEKKELKHPSLSMVSFIQPNVACNLFADKNLNGLGVNARFLPFFHKSFTCGENSANDFKGNFKLYSQKITSLLDLYFTQNLNSELYTATLTPEAKFEVKKFEQFIEFTIIPTMPKEAEPALRKLHGQAVRLSWAIHAWNNDRPHLSPITAKEIIDGISLCSYLLPHIAYIYDPCGLQACNDAVRIIHNLQNINTGLSNEELTNGYISSRTIQQRTGIRAGKVLNALRLLERYNWLRIIDNGRQSNIAVLNPNYMNYKIS